jgi:hypothetical protein
MFPRERGDRPYLVTVCPDGIHKCRLLWRAQRVTVKSHSIELLAEMDVSLRAEGYPR